MFWSSPLLPSAKACSPAPWVPPYYKEQCDLIGCHFLDARDMGAEFNTVDYMHLTKKGHATMAEELAKRIPELLK